MTSRSLASAVLAACCGVAQAQTVVHDAWLRHTVAQQRAGTLFVTLTAPAGGRLLAAATPVAGIVEIHEMSMQGDIMRMRALPDGLPLPAGQPVAMDPGGVHIMLMDLKQALKTGDRVPVTLTVEHTGGGRETLRLQVEVRALVSSRPTMKH